MYQTGGTIKETLTAVQNSTYVLPAIQREFVWKPDQIAKLKSMTMGMEFQPGGKLILAGVKYDGKSYESEAAWEVVEASDSQITIKTIEASGKATDAALMLESDDVFLMPLQTEVANLGAMRFERLR